jgi:hypothetical protein
VDRWKYHILSVMGGRDWKERLETFGQMQERSNLSDASRMASDWVPEQERSL